MQNVVKPSITKTNYTRQEAAAAMGCSLISLDAFMHRRDNPLPFFRVGTRKVLIPVSAMQEWIEAETKRVSGV